MTVMEKFRSVMGEGETYDRPSKTVLAKYAKKFPERLIEDWKSHGWCRFADGLFWTVNPQEYDDTLKEWLPDWAKGGSRTFVFARSAFGDLLVSHEEKIGHLSVHYGRYVDSGVGFDVWMYTMDEEYLSTVLDGTLARKAIKKLGSPGPGEMFTFEPALALGGEAKLKYVKKVKLLPQLSLLSQLFDSITIE